jgi:hypothetical protein
MEQALHHSSGHGRHRRHRRHRMSRKRVAAICIGVPLFSFLVLLGANKLAAWLSLIFH